LPRARKATLNRGQTASRSSLEKHLRKILSERKEKKSRLFKPSKLKALRQHKEGREKEDPLGKWRKVRS